MEVGLLAGNWMEVGQMEASSSHVQQGPRELLLVVEPISFRFLELEVLFELGLVQILI